MTPSQTNAICNIPRDTLPTDPAPDPQTPLSDPRTPQIPPPDPQTPQTPPPDPRTPQTPPPDPRTRRQTLGPLRPRRQTLGPLRPRRQTPPPDRNTRSLPQYADSELCAYTEACCSAVPETIQKLLILEPGRPSGAPVAAARLPTFGSTAHGGVTGRCQMVIGTAPVGVQRSPGRTIDH